MKTELHIALIFWEKDTQRGTRAEPILDRTDQELEKSLDVGEEIVATWTVSLSDEHRVLSGNDVGSHLASAHQAIESIDALGNTPHMRDLLMHFFAEGYRAGRNIGS